MHICDEEFFHHPYIGFLKDGVPGSIMHRRDNSIQYPALQRAEDSAFLTKWQNSRYTLLNRSMSYLFIRCYHGGNTWGKEHFKTRIRNTIPDALSFFWHRFIRNDLFSHPRFRLCVKSKMIKSGR
jgi:hypothetical protein